MNQKERVFWSDLMARIEPDAAMYAAVEARLRAEADAPIDEAWVRARLAGIVAAETQTRRRRRRLGAVAVLLVFALPALALGTRAILWPANNRFVEDLEFSNATGLLWETNETDLHRAGALAIVMARLQTAIDGLRSVSADTTNPEVAARAAQRLDDLVQAFAKGAEPTSMPGDNDWNAVVDRASDRTLPAAARLADLEHLTALAFRALNVMQTFPADTLEPEPLTEQGRNLMLEQMRLRATGEVIRDGR